MKKKLYVIILLAFFLLLSSCGEKERPTFNLINEYVISDVDFSLNVEINNNSFKKIEGNNITSDDYHFDNNLLVIKQSYLLLLGVGSYRFSFVTDNNATSFDIIIKNKDDEKLNNPTITSIDSNVFYKNSNSNLKWSINLYNQELKSVNIENQIVSSTNYILYIDKIEIKSEYLNSLKVGKLKISINTKSGIGTSEFYVLEKIEISEKNDFIKMPGEEIINEDFRKLVSGNSQVLKYKYELKQGEGDLVDNSDGTFSYTPNTLKACDVIITFIVEDKYGQVVKKDITLVYKEVNPEEISLKEFDLSISYDLSFEINLYGNEQPFSVELESIEGNEITEDDYKYEGHVLTIKNNYLQNLEVGTYRFNLKSTAGMTTFDLKIIDTPILTPLDELTVNQGHRENISFRIDFKGNSFIGLFINNDEVDSSNYSFSENTFILKGSFISTINSSTTFIFRTNIQDLQFVINIHKSFEISDKDDYIKLPGEVITNEDFRSLVSNAYGEVNYQYTLKSGSGTLVDNLDGTFNYNPNGVYSEVAVITFKVEDGFGSIKEKDITLTYKTVNPIIYDGEVGSKVVDKADLSDLVMTIDTFGVESNTLYYEIKDILLENVSIGSENYVSTTNESQRHFTLKKEYLETLDLGIHLFTVKTACGEASFNVTVTDTREIEVDPQSITVYLNEEINDLEFVVTPYSNEITDTIFTIDGLAFTKDVHYTYSLNTLTVLSSFIEGLEESDVVIKANEVALITIYVRNTKELPVEVEQTSENFRIDDANDVTYSVNLNENIFLKVLDVNEEELEAGVDYVFEEGVLTFKGKYLTESYRFGTDSYTYTIVTNSSSHVITLEYDHPENRILNGGFETGTIYGWNSYSIWKNESGMMAWTNDRVVSGGYFDQNYTYNRDGSYNLGIYGGSISKDSGQERMGHLRSSDFVLGGNGYITFKLGGGRTTSLAYVSVRKTTTNEEVARFANPNFNNKELSKTENAEAYMFGYYFDLSSYIGESLYITITDSASNEWCVLSADSFKVYNTQQPSTTELIEAVNIVPTIQNVGQNENSVVNGYFDSSLDNWTNVDNIFKIENGFAISSNGGDGATGVMRSSAFAVTTNKYIRFSWAGGLKFDKQVFISVKEVGTNIEVLRFVRRDNLSSKQNGDFDNHMLDLSSLDETKEYYLEIVDNVEKSWGVNKIDDIRFISDNEWNEVIITDRALSINGINFDFIYQLPY